MIFTYRQTSEGGILTMQVFNDNTSITKQPFNNSLEAYNELVRFLTNSDLLDYHKKELDKFKDLYC